MSAFTAAQEPRQKPGRSLVIWIGRRYADMEVMEDPEMKALVRDRLEQLDNSWPVVVVIFSSLAIAVAWFTIPPGA